MDDLNRRLPIIVSSLCLIICGKDFFVVSDITLRGLNVKSSTDLKPLARMQ
jgi:hypothetical protein